MQSPLADLAKLIAAQSGIDAPALDYEAVIARLPAEERDKLYEAVEAFEAAQRGNKYDIVFPDEGTLRRQLYRKHMEFFRAGADYTERLFQAGNRVGKAQPNDEPVLTPTGWRPMGDLQVGDLVVGSDGKATRIVGVYPQGVRPIVRVIASDGASTRCDLDHLWSVRPVRDGRLSPYRVETAASIMASMDAGGRWMLPERPCVEFDAPVELPADPYLIGLLLGDGGLSTDRVLISTEDAEIVAFCAQQAAHWGCDLRHVGGCTWHFATTIKRGGRHHNVLRAVLDGLGMAGKTSHSKRIPETYMFASAADRLALLQGLMDTDGSCSRANGARAFYSVNRDLCEDVAAIARSLGMNASVKAKSGRYQGEHHISWKVHIAASAHSIFRLERKREQERFAGRRMRGVMIEAITPDGEAECTCIEVAGADHLYVTRDFLVTHNTIAGSFEVTAHTTGRYKHWWEGRRFNRPTHGWAAGDTYETTRDIIQKELFGNVAWVGGAKTFDGTGMIPRECIGDVSWRRSVADFADMIQVKHVSGGWSTVGLKSYDQGRRTFQGTAKDWIWTDEEPPMDVYNEALIRLMTTRGIMLITFTPLNGLSDVVLSFMEGDLV